MLSHIAKNGKGCIKDILDVFPELDRADVTNMLQELRRSGKTEFMGPRRYGYWILKKKTI